ncbi:anthranilate synthase component I family protein [Parapedobacter sp. ISTM3]|uniref:Para-aminobenzoate synthetase component 1 n=1 Tax=Parapedobacter luteus TaxID=623280 RepID=A0A1T5AVN4_9SPHI|nr:MULTISPECIES: anthranilate synthase component I family protein [Parapedobacter]MBK1440279.1 anthranilate synthase component I family protein [Parapedobacter sp. ISTM3]SKB39035.1 para-aminobenzoate synthetase component 1 [Parapedobacter luteus]
MVSLACHLDDSDTFTQQALQWAAQFDNVCYLDSNGYRDNYGNIDVFIAVGCVESFTSTGADTFGRLQRFIDRHPNTWIPGYLGYDLKNEIEDLHSTHPNYTDFPDAYFFVPQYTLLIGQYNAEIKGPDPQAIIKQIEAIEISEEPLEFKGHLKSRMNRSAYFSAFSALQRYIQQGDIYEVNLCQEFFAEEVSLNPLSAYRRLNEVSPTPFSCFFKFGQKYILSASPERFLSKSGNTLLSQPIKGTAPRGKTAAEDEQLKATLAANPKEISENIMIVDLVRNDLTRSAKPGTVKASELLQIHSFKQVHQLISTITCQIQERMNATETIRNTFPPGSMTGAPKISAMKLIDRYENSRRGVYSGALGYFSPQGNYDFSVVIRTLLYNAENGYLSFHTGGAITHHADPEKEYNECLLKGKALFEVLKSQ